MLLSILSAAQVSQLNLLCWKPESISVANDQEPKLTICIWKWNARKQTLRHTTGQVHTAEWRALRTKFFGTGKMVTPRQGIKLTASRNVFYSCEALEGVFFPGLRRGVEGGGKGTREEKEKDLKTRTVYHLDPPHETGSGNWMRLWLISLGTKYVSCRRERFWKCTYSKKVCMGGVGCIILPLFLL